MRQAMYSHQTATAAARAERLLDRIKIETRWLLISTPAQWQIDESGYAADRKNLMAMWPLIRHRRLDTDALVSFYDLVGEHASQLAHLIEIRRQRAFQRASARRWQ